MAYRSDRRLPPDRPSPASLNYSPVATFSDRHLVWSSAAAISRSLALTSPALSGPSLSISFCTGGKASRLGSAYL